MSQRSQRIILWWGLTFTLMYGLAVWVLIKMIPPPAARLGPEEIAAFYRGRQDEIRVGAVLCAWTAGFMVPITCVVAEQLRRLEVGRVWTNMTLLGGGLMSIWLALPPIFWGVAAFTPTRDAEVTALMHELGTLTFVTTDQHYIFMWVAVAFICFMQTDVPHSPFPRWFGYLTAWAAFMFEAGALAFLTRTGPFAWNGVLVLWVPILVFSLWIAIQSYLLLKALKAQQADRQPA